VVSGKPSVAGEELELRVGGHSSLSFAVVVGAVGLLALGRFAGVELVEIEVVFLFLPAVGVLTAVLLSTPISISLYEILSLPIRTLLFLILVEVRLSPEVLPIVGVDALIPRVRRVRVGAPHRLEVEHIEVDVTLHLLKEGDREL